MRLHGSVFLLGEAIAWEQGINLLLSPPPPSPLTSDGLSQSTQPHLSLHSTVNTCWPSCPPSHPRRAILAPSSVFLAPSTVPNDGWGKIKVGTTHRLKGKKWGATCPLPPPSLPAASEDKSSEMSSCPWTKFFHSYYFPIIAHSLLSQHRYQSLTIRLLDSLLVYYLSLQLDCKIHGANRCLFYALLRISKQCL